MYVCVWRGGGTSYMHTFYILSVNKRLSINSWCISKCTHQSDVLYMFTDNNNIVGPRSDTKRVSALTPTRL